MNVKISDGRKWFYQWDINQRLTLEDIPVGTPIHFSNLNDTLALVVLAASDESGVYVNVPNILLQKSGELHVYVYITNGEEGHTEQYWEYEIIEREQPSDYVYIETETKPLGSGGAIPKPVVIKDLFSTVAGAASSAVVTNYTFDELCRATNSGVLALRDQEYGGVIVPTLQQAIHGDIGFQFISRLQDGVSMGFITLVNNTGTLYFHREATEIIVMSDLK